MVACVHGRGTSCTGWCLRTFAKCFLVGSGCKTALNVLIFLIFRRGRKISPALLQKLIDVRYGLFLGTYSGGWKVFSCLTRCALRQLVHRKGCAPQHSSVSHIQPSCSVFSPLRSEASGPLPLAECTVEKEQQQQGLAEWGESTRKKRDKYLVLAGDVAAGAVSGLSLYWLPKADRKGLALYSFTRSGEFLARFLSSSRLLPSFVEGLAPHLDVVLMTLSASQILFSYIMERDTLDPTYSSFLVRFGGKDVRVIDSIAPMRRGGKLNRAMFMEWARELQLPNIMGVLFGLHHSEICDVVHPGTGCVSHFIRFTWEGFWRAFPMYATLHSVTTVLFLLLKMRSFIVARGYHRSLPPAAEKREDDDNGDENNDEVGEEEEEEEEENRQRKTMHTRASGQEASLALNRDHSMRALHRRRRADDGDTPDCQEEEEEEEDNDKEGVEEEVENKGGSASSRKTRKTCTNGGSRKSSSSSSSKQRLPRGQGAGRMVVCCIRNLWVHLRSPDQNVLALLRFLFTQVLPKIALNIARSSLFLGLYCASGWFGACIAQRTFLMKDVRWFYPWLAIPGLASLIEVPARRRELALYCLPKAMESCYAVCKKYDKIPRGLQYFRNGEVFLFSVGSAVTLFCYLNGKQSIKPTFLHLMNWLWA